MLLSYTDHAAPAVDLGDTSMNFKQMMIPNNKGLNPSS